MFFAILLLLPLLVSAWPSATVVVTTQNWSPLVARPCEDSNSTGGKTHEGSSLQSSEMGFTPISEVGGTGCLYQMCESFVFANATERWQIVLVPSDQGNTTSPDESVSIFHTSLFYAIDSNRNRVSDFGMCDDYNDFNSCTQNPVNVWNSADSSRWALVFQPLDLTQC